jgi:dGTPase
MYEARDIERFVTEPAKRPGRTEFMRDRARLIHSAALRRLAAKTQVAVPWENDFQRTRLSHSLECAQIGREFGASLGADPDLIDTACLAHDLGHPPFGHNGESALAEVSKDIGGFEGNAQTFRILTRLEAKTYVGERSVGLNLTRASLDACTKYPWSASKNPKKFGVYEDDQEIFNWMRQGAPDDQRTFEAQIMDWSDDVSYSVHDFEDAIVASQLSVPDIEEDLSEIATILDRDYLMASKEEISAALNRLQALSCWPKDFDGMHRDLARLKDSTSQLIGRFVYESEKATREKYGSGNLRRFDASLEIPREQQVEVALLKAISAFYLIQAPEAQARYAKQRQVIYELVEMIQNAGPQVLDTVFLDAWHQADSAGRLRVIIDQVASLTDPAAYALHAKLSS